MNKMIFFKRKIVNPAIEKFNAEIKQNGILLEEGWHYGSKIIIRNTETFLSFAKRNNVTTIFIDERWTISDVTYFYIVDGLIVRSGSFEKMVKDT